MFIRENECVQREPEGHVDISAAADDYYYTSIKRNILQHEPNLHYIYSIQSNQHPVDNKGIDFPLGSLGHAPHANM